MKCAKLLSLSFLLTFSLAASKEKPKEIKQKPSKSPSVNEIVEKFEEKFSKLPSYKAKFKQTVFSKTVETSDTTEGAVYVVKPDHFRWESETDGTVQIISKKKMIFLQKQRKKRIVDIYEDYAKHIDAAFLDFLTGKTKLKTHYNPTLLENGEKKAKIKLLPKKGGKESFIAEIDKTSYFLTALTYETADTRTTVDLTDIKTDFAYEESLFSYRKQPDDLVTKHD